MNNKREKALRIAFIIMFVIVVIGTIAIIDPGKQLQEARNSSRYTQIINIQKMVSYYRTYNGGDYPECIPDYPESIAVEECYDLVEFMESKPEDPQKKYEYIIKYSDAQHKGFQVTSTAPEWIVARQSAIMEE